MEPNNNYFVNSILVHNCFKGNLRRNQRQISSAIDNVGGILNAYTDYECTAYWAKVGNRYKDLAIEVITDLALKPIFPKKEVDKEREVIIQELKMYEDDSRSYVEEVFNTELYSRESGFYLPIIGTRDSLKNIGREELVKYHKDNYSNPTLIIVGDVENLTAIENPVVPRNNLFQLNKKRNSTHLVNRNNITQANILMGNALRIPISKFSIVEQKFCLALLDSVYEDMSGRLFNSIREKNNLVYRVGFNWAMYSNSSIQWNVSAGLDADKISKARKLAVKELTRPISKKELKIALQKEIGAQEMDLDSITYIGNSVVHCLTTGLDYNEFIYNYKENLERAIKLVNDFQKEMHFEDNLLVGIVPKKRK